MRSYQSKPAAIVHGHSPLYLPCVLCCVVPCERRSVVNWKNVQERLDKAKAAKQATANK